MRPAFRFRLIALSIVFGCSSDGGGGLSASCDDRTGGAMIDFKVVGETLRMWITDNAFIDEAITRIGAGPGRIPVFNDLIDGRDCDAQWSWHSNPATALFADVTIEACDGLPSYVEADKSYWLNTLDQFCPWSGEVIAVDDRR